MKNLFIICLSIITIGAYAQTSTSSNASPSEQEYVANINSLTEQIQEDPNNSALYVQRAENIYYLNAIYPNQTVSSFKLKHAIVDINKAIQVDANNPKLYSIRGMYKRNIEGNLEAAYYDLTRAIELEPDNATWYLERTNYASLEQACEDWQKCAEMGNGTCAEIRSSVCSK